MAEAGLFIGYGLPVRGRERQALKVFGEADGLNGRPGSPLGRGALCALRRRVGRAVAVVSQPGCNGERWTGKRDQDREVP
jgi:hypothetical protein